jgi:hypothetical protein
MTFLVGSDDEIFYADRYAPLIHQQRADIPGILIAGVNHMGMVTDTRALTWFVAEMK